MVSYLTLLCTLSSSIKWGEITPFQKNSVEAYMRLKKKNHKKENFLAVQWLGLHASTAGGVHFHPQLGN